MEPLISAMKLLVFCLFVFVFWRLGMGLFWIAVISVRELDYYPNYFQFQVTARFKPTTLFSLN